MYEKGRIVHQLNSNMRIYQGANCLKFLNTDFSKASFYFPGNPLISNRDFVWTALDKVFKEENTGKKIGIVFDSFAAISFGCSLDTSSIGIEVPPESGILLPV